MDKDQVKPKSDQSPGSAKDPKGREFGERSAHHGNGQDQGSPRSDSSYQSPQSDQRKRP